MGVKIKFLQGLLVLGLISSFWSCSSLGPAPSSGEKAKAAPKLVLISIDGFRPVFYTEAKYRALAPTLAFMSDQGVRARKGIRPVFPSITYPDHVAMVTGAHPGEHGVWSNRVFVSGKGESEDWYWYEKQIRVPTLWQRARDQGLKVALLRWPSSTGAKVDWNVPEIFTPGHFDIQKDWELIQNNSNRAWIQKALASSPVQVPKNVADMDLIDTQITEYLLTHEKPDLILLHLVDLDQVQHHLGTDSPEVGQVLSRIDQQVSRVISHLDLSRSTVLVTGDHGFASILRKIHIERLIQEAGLDSLVLEQSDGGHAVLYPKEPSQKFSNPNLPCEKLTKFGRAKGLDFLLISRRELDDLHSFPGALCALDPGNGYAFVDWEKSGRLVDVYDKPHGTHGYLSTRPEMQAGFFIYGKAVTQKHSILKEDPQMPDIAPTAAQILGFSFETPSGHLIAY